MRRIEFVASVADRLDRAVSAGVPELSRRRARGLIGHGAVYVEGRRCKVASRTVSVGARVIVHLEPVEPPPELDIIFEDEHLVAVNKPAGLAVNESETSARASLVGLLGQDARVVHRLDLHTTGVVVVARVPETADAISAVFRERKVTKHYRAVTLGVPASGWIDAPIGQDPRRPRAQAVRADGRPARTKVEVCASHEGLSAVRLELDTGRTHQIRVHLAHLGAPIFGDTRYGAKRAVNFAGEPVQVDRPLLHAEHLAFSVFGNAYAFDAPPPEDLALLWDRVSE